MFFFDQEFKVLLVCFVVLVATTSAATVCECEDKNKTYVSDILTEKNR